MTFKKGLIGLVLLWAVITGAVYWASEARADPYDDYVAVVDDIIPDDTQALGVGLATCLDMYQGNDISDEYAQARKAVGAEDGKYVVDQALIHICPELQKPSPPARISGGIGGTVLR